MLPEKFVVVVGDDRVELRGFEAHVIDRFVDHRGQSSSFRADGGSERVNEPLGKGASNIGVGVSDGEDLFVGIPRPCGDGGAAGRKIRDDPRDLLARDLARDRIDQTTPMLDGIRECGKRHFTVERERERVVSHADALP